jgi:uncharacterized delta-60 repeat protein
MNQNESLVSLFVKLAVLSTFFLLTACSGGGSSGSPGESSSLSDVAALAELNKSATDLALAGWTVEAEDALSFRTHVASLALGKTLVAHGNRIRKLNADLSVDTSFGDSGYIQVIGAVRALHVNGSAVWVVSSRPRSLDDSKPTEIFIQKRNLADGSEDVNFGSLFEGVRCIRFTLDDLHFTRHGFLTHLVLNTFSNGDLLMVMPSNNRGVWMSRFKATGHVYLWGESIVNAGYFAIYPRDVEVLPDDRFLVTGYSHELDRSLSRQVPFIYAARVNSNGKLDTSFGVGGEIKPRHFSFEKGLTPDYVYSNTSTFARLEDDVVCCALRDAEGRIYFIKTIVTGTGRGSLLVVRTSPDGVWDNSFAGVGYMILKVSSHHIDLNRVKRLSDGKILLVGGLRLDAKGYPYPMYSNKYHQAFALRLNADFSVDTSFADSGVLSFGSVNGVSESIFHIHEHDGIVSYFGSVWLPKFGMGYLQEESLGRLFYRRM